MHMLLCACSPFPGVFIGMVLNKFCESFVESGGVDAVDTASVEGVEVVELSIALGRR